MTTDVVPMSDAELAELRNELACPNPQFGGLLLTSVFRALIARLDAAESVRDLTAKANERLTDVVMKRNECVAERDRLAALNKELVSSAEAALVLLDYLDQELGAALPCEDARFDDVIAELQNALAKAQPQEPDRTSG